MTWTYPIVLTNKSNPFVKWIGCASYAFDIRNLHWQEGLLLFIPFDISFLRYLLHVWIEKPTTTDVKSLSITMEDGLTAWPPRTDMACLHILPRDRCPLRRWLFWFFSALLCRFEMQGKIGSLNLSMPQYGLTEILFYVGQAHVSINIRTNPSTHCQEPQPSSTFDWVHKWRKQQCPQFTPSIVQIHTLYPYSHGKLHVFPFYLSSLPASSLTKGTCT